jgi:hypothetical protein
MSADLVSTLQSLRALVGAEEFATAAQEVLASPAPEPGKRRRGVKKEKKTREPTEWNKYVRTVWEELKQSSDKVKYSEAMSEAKRRRPSPAEDAEPAAGGAAAAAQPVEDTEAERRRVFQYLFKLQDSGRTNMLGCVPYLMRECGLEEYAAEAYREEYISKYDEMKRKYGGAAAEEAAPVEKKSGGGRGRKAATAAGST